MRPNPTRRAPPLPTVPATEVEGSESPADRRGFIRHPSSVPIHIRVPPESNPTAHTLRDLGYGGLAFRSRRQLLPGAVISIHIEVAHSPIAIEAQVVWCNAASHAYEVGAQFLAGQDAFRIRMIEQICHIREYRRQVRAEEGRKLTPRQAALEWVTRHAATFPSASASN